jgi:hypothetical protein
LSLCIKKVIISLLSLSLSCWCMLMGVSYMPGTWFLMLMIDVIIDAMTDATIGVQ